MLFLVFGTQCEATSLVLGELEDILPDDKSSIKWAESRLMYPFKPKRLFRSEVAGLQDTKEPVQVSRPPSATMTWNRAEAGQEKRWFTPTAPRTFHLYPFYCRVTPASSPSPTLLSSVTPPALAAQAPLPTPLRMRLFKTPSISASRLLLICDQANT